MNFLSITAVAVLVSSSALAQSSREEGRNHDRWSDRWEHGGSWREHEWRHGSRRHNGGASFMLRRGDATVAVRCDPADSMRAASMQR
jgi:hypothetical protein